MKGKDWECPSCSNVNWSWRTNCNMCSTAKIILPNVSYFNFLIYFVLFLYSSFISIQLFRS
jgi:hypothetical protein